VLFWRGGAGHAREQKENRGHGPLLQVEVFTDGAASGEFNRRTDSQKGQHH
jgi:hypothetical protein